MKSTFFFFKQIPYFKSIIITCHSNSKLCGKWGFEARHPDVTLMDVLPVCCALRGPFSSNFGSELLRAL